MTIATANGGRQRTPTDSLPQATRVAALVARAATWLRDEEAAGSNPATPTTETASHGISGDLLSLFATPSVRFWEPDGSVRSSLQSRQGHRQGGSPGCGAGPVRQPHARQTRSTFPGAKDLVAMAFSTDPPTAGNPRLRLNDYSASCQNWTSQHEGHSFYGCCPRSISSWRRLVVMSEDSIASAASR